MILKELLSDVQIAGDFLGDVNIDIPSVWDDSRRVTAGSLFAMMPGGEAFIDEALARGAVVLVLPQSMRKVFFLANAAAILVFVEDPRRAFIAILSRFYGALSRKVQVTGVTGTNGKTTVTYFLESVWKAGGLSSGVTGTVNCRMGDQVVSSKNTTPGMLDNQIFLSQLASRRIFRAAMEVSSHALAQGRVDLIDFRGAVFTNLTGDHLDFHGTMENYFEAKSLLFRGLSPSAFAVINYDDVYGRRLAALTRARIISYGLTAGVDVTANISDCGLKGTCLVVRAAGQEIDIRTSFIGRHNVCNILAAFSAGMGEGLDMQVIKRGIESLEYVPGRLERVDCGQDFFVFIDYAHTDDGIRNVLECLKKVKHERLIVVFGCGGDRDRSKRHRMGRLVCELADYAVITSDNPRSEDPRAIIDEIVTGYTKDNYDVVLDRAEAIERALGLARTNDIVLLAGKGHETCQIVKGCTIDFVERDIVSRLLR